MSLTMRYFEFRQGGSKENSRNYVVENQRCMYKFKRALEPLSGGLSRNGQAINWDIRGSL